MNSSRSVSYAMEFDTWLPGSAVWFTSTKVRAIGSISQMVLLLSMP